MAKHNVTLAIFDVRPVNPATGRIDFDFINGLGPTVDLISYGKERKVIPDESSYFNILPVKAAPSDNAKENAPEGVRQGGPYGAGKEEVLQELQSTLSKDVDFKKELKSFGGRLVNSVPKLRPRSLPFLVPEKELPSDLEKFRKEFSRVLSGHGKRGIKGNEVKAIAPPHYLPWAPHLSANEEQDPQPLFASHGAKELDSVLSGFRSRTETASVPRGSARMSESDTAVLLRFAIGIATAFILTFSLFGGLNLKNSIIQNSNQAYLNLDLVREKLSDSNFLEAASSFVLAARNFELLKDDLGKASSFFKVLNTVTLGGVSGTSDLVEAGRLISEAGTDLGAALEKIYEINFISVIQGKNDANILEVLSDFRLGLIQASRNINKAEALISGADSGLIPESEKAKFQELKSQLPEFNEFIERAVNYSEAVMVILGQSGPQRYLVLFQNSSELRPTGGFPGSYARVEFDSGVMEEFFVDDIYNPDGQLKERIIPPAPLQKITPNWGLRDANWFVDFPTSAQKAAEFYYKDTGILVDGVFALNVNLVPELLKITGPIEMADFGVTLDSKNFLTEVQEEVEYLQTKDQPKQILVEFAPKLLDRLSGLSREKWLEALTLFVDATQEKNLLAYFVDRRLQNFAFENGLAGEIKEADSDYLMVTHSNIMGSKTDAVIENSISLDLEKDEQGNLIHQLELTRKHNGGDSDFGFYNRTNNDYVRILVPFGAELIELSGNDAFDSSPLLDYRSQGFTADPDLERYESKIKKTGGLEIFEEGGKKVYAFWMVIEPKKTRTVRLKYKTRPLGENGEIYVQKQPGTESELTVSSGGKTLLKTILDSDKVIIYD